MPQNESTIDDLMGVAGTLPESLKASSIDSPWLFTFKNHDELIKTLNSLSDDQLVMIGYVDDNNDIQRLDYKKLRSQAIREFARRVDKKMIGKNTGTHTPGGNEIPGLQAMNDLRDQQRTLLQQLVEEEK